MFSKSFYSGPMDLQWKSLRLWLLLCASTLVLSVLACAAGPGPNAVSLDEDEFDPSSADLSPFDRQNPPLIAEMNFASDGAAMNAILYEAQGVGPHPTVVLLHGFPGNERNLDLAQAVRRAGWNVVFFHYRGAWGSGGQFSFLHVIEDVGAVVAAVRESEFAESHRIDEDRIALVGHSMGGFAALIAGAELSAVDCVVSMSGANLGGTARILENDPERAAGFAATIDGWSGPIRGPGGAELIAEIIEHADRFDTRNHAASLAKKKLLLVAGGRDVVTPPELHHGPLVETLRAVDASSLSTFVFDLADHAYSGQRMALARRVTSWLQSECTANDSL